MFRRPLPSAGCPECGSPGFAGTMGRSDSRTPVPPHFVAFAWRYRIRVPVSCVPWGAPAAGRTRRRQAAGLLIRRSRFRLLGWGDVRASQVPGEPIARMPWSVIPVRSHAQGPGGREVRYGLRRYPTPGPGRMCLSGLDVTACELAVYASQPGIAPGPRKTRFRLGTRLCRVGLGLPQGSVQGSASRSYVMLCLLGQAFLTHRQPHLTDRGREGRLTSASPPAKPDEQFSRIRLSSQWAIFMDWHARRWACSSVNSPAWAKNRLGQR